MANKEKYFYCVSLGYNCRTAGSMERYGLRFFSGPFDWCISDFPSVLKMMENNFIDFLNKENLQIDVSEPKFFQDIKYGFNYRHDVKEDFEKEYSLIVEKYKKRIERFQSAIKNPTCFFRIVKSEAEIRYIDNHKEYIDRIIKCSNPQNVVIYLLFNGMIAPKNEKYFYLNISMNEGTIINSFDRADGLLDYCVELIDEQDKETNLAFFKKSSFFHNHKGLCLLNDNGIKEKMNEIFKGKDLYVWGAGQYGVQVERILNEAGIKILGFIDNAEEKRGTYINNIRVYGFEEVEEISTVFIDVAFFEISEKISSQIRQRDANIEIYTWSTIWDLFPLF